MCDNNNVNDNGKDQNQNPRAPRNESHNGCGNLARIVVFSTITTGAVDPEYIHIKHSPGREEILVRTRIIMLNKCIYKTHAESSLLRVINFCVIICLHYKYVLYNIEAVRIFGQTSTVIVNIRFVKFLVITNTT